MANLVINIPDDKVDRIKELILKSTPKKGGELSMSDVDYIKSLIKNYLITLAKAGEEEELRENLSTDYNTIITY